MKKKFIILLLILSFCFVPIKTYAYNESDMFSDMSTSDLMDYFYSYVNPLYDKFLCINVNSSNIYCWFGNDINVLTIDTSATRYRMRYTVNGSVVADQWGNTFEVLSLNVIKNQTPAFQRTPQSSNPTLNSGNISSYFTNTNILDTSGNTVFSANVNYTPTVSGCPECEECETCPSQAGFPFTTEEFYVLLLLISIIICMNFLRWCFPFKKGRDLS